MDHYSVNVVWGDEDECFIATIPEFEGLSAHGDTQEEAILEAKTALKGFLEVMKEDGEDIPTPHTYNSFSGQTRIRLPKSLHQSLSNQAKIENVSLNTIIVKLLAERGGINKFTKDIEYIKTILEEKAMNPDNLITETDRSDTKMTLITNYEKNNQWVVEQ